MSVITNLTRMWLTRSIKPFQFKNTSEKLLYTDCENLGLYVHIPFCKNICNFCPYCKTVYNEEKCESYIESLLQEIHYVGKQSTEKKEVTSLYFGGGTPALAANRIKDIIKALEKYFIITDGMGIELHPENVTISTLQTLKDSGITKISIGIQSFQTKYQSMLGREAINAVAMAQALAAVPFETVSMDFIFALPLQTYDDLKNDIDTAFANGANHVAIYPFIDFSFTETKVPAMRKNEKQKLLDEITVYCLGKELLRTSIWTFASEKHACYSSMTRDNFLGFGCSATTLLKDQFKINTFSVEEYCKKINAGEIPTSLTLKFSLRQRMIYYLFWTAYSTKVSSNDFKKFFGVSLKKMYGLEFGIAKLLGFFKEENGIYSMTLKGAFYYHYYENFYTFAYIDKMWGLLRKEAFPKEMKL
ncbi:radical SAM protein [Treponema phagedenis]|uniref:Coproporphyrinogen dehydrogenase family protein n=1 Tax=Treponema phagedenis TaxID=162 RepID=A0A0B7GW22_TREPH|nr:radical SAM protein [Treponema phagedenis]QEJ94782.1 radical SAM protein [Treponema phagedenis]QSH93887.1 radical SAM protein [Treponema phagedenis]QSH99663.1 radical SAM protein [Treponema phagedenis]CEM60856.1 Coproporphyrinogen dehydrogenase family protein [Treponema phagedenis]